MIRNQSEKKVLELTLGVILLLWENRRWLHLEFHSSRGPFLHICDSSNISIPNSFHLQGFPHNLSRDCNIPTFRILLFIIYYYLFIFVWCVWIVGI